jgi:hypothetical protein
VQKESDKNFVAEIRIARQILRIFEERAGFFECGEDGEQQKNKVVGLAAVIEDEVEVSNKTVPDEGGPVHIG